MTNQYNEYLRKHINAVKACYTLLTGENLDSHDASKLTAEELGPYDRYFYPEENRVVKNAQIETDFDYAWLHHQNVNRHHWQYWILIEDEGKIKPLEMPDRYINEMVADWGSFAYQKRDGNELLKWYATHVNKMILAPETKKKVEDLVKTLARKLNEKFR